MAQTSSYELLHQLPKTLHSNPSPYNNTRVSSSSIGSHAPRLVPPLWRDWWPEIASVVLSAIAIIAIIFTLQPHDGQPLPQWPYSISVNALVSIYVVVFKAAILFMVAESLSQLKWLWYQKGRPLQHIDVYDQASRGPWGSLLLLWSIAPRNYLAGAGALVTIFMVIIDPFTQQLLTYYTCHTPVAGQHALVNLTTFLDHLGPGSVHLHTYYASVPTRWKNAINAGIFSPGQKIVATCPSGNCTFDSLYNTVGWCSKCTDISSELLIADQTVQNFTFTFDSRPSPVPGNASFYNTTLPSKSLGYSTNPNIYVYSIKAGVYVNYTSMGMLPGSDETIAAIVLGKTNGQFEEAFMSDNSSCSNPNNNKSWRCQGYGAASCSLFPCVKKINGSIETGVLSETVVDISPREEWKLGSRGTLAVVASILDVGCLSSGEISSLQTAGYVIAPNQKWLGYNLTWNPAESVVPDDAPFPKSLQAHGCLFSYYHPTVLSLWSGYLSSIFTGFVWGNVGPSIDPTELHGPQTILQFFNWGDISFERTAEIFSNISESMTILTRQTGNINCSAPAVGVVYKDQTCLRVRWAWLSFPAVLALMAWGFFAVTLRVQSGAKWLPSWKSSSLPLLLNGTVLNDAHNDASQKDEMAKMARRVRVRLGLTGKGLGLVPS